MSNSFSIADFGAVPGGEVLCTAAIQAASDAAGAVKGELVIPAGVWLSGAVWLHGDMTLRFEKGAELRGTTDESQYPHHPHPRGRCGDGLACRSAQCNRLR